jgi:hypothetical protein
MVLNADWPLPRKLGGGPETWYELEIDGVPVPLRGRRRIELGEEEQVWRTSGALLYDFEPHGALLKLTVMSLVPGGAGRAMPFTETRVILKVCRLLG